MTAFNIPAQAVPMLCVTVGLLVAGCATRTTHESPTVYRPGPNPNTIISRAPRAYELAPVPATPAVAATQSEATLDSARIDAAPIQTWRPATPADILRSDAAPTGVVSSDAAPTDVVSSDADSVVIPLHREQVQVGTREVESGAVRLRKVVRTETVNQPVTLRQEELVIDRIPAGETARSGEPGQRLSDLAPFEEQSITIPLRREEPVIQTEVVQTGQVVARKNVATEPTTVQRSVRNEEVEIVKLGDPQNVSISPALRADSAVAGESAPPPRPPVRDMGSAPTTQTGTAAASVDSPIASLNVLAATGELRSLVGKRIQITRAPVHEVLSDQLMTVRSPDGKAFLVWSPRIPAGLARGDMVDIRGRIEPAPEVKADLDFGPGTDQSLISQPIYIEASTLDRTLPQAPAPR